MISDITITSLETIQAFDLDGSYAFTLDELQNATIANTQDSTEITGKAGRKLNSIKRNKAVTISGTNGLISGGMMAAQVGGNWEEKTSTPVKWTDYLVVKSNSAETSYKAVGTAGAEIEGLYIRKPDGTIDTSMTQATSATAGKFAYAASTKKITFNDGELDDGTEITVVYTRNVAGSVLKNVSDSYSKKLELFVDALGEDKCGKTYRVQFHIPKADFSGEFDIEMGDNQSVHAFSADSLAGACGASGELWDYTVFGSAAADVA